jgi:GBP family porin
MKKTLIALAAVAASSAALAQSSVTMYGVVDLSLESVKNADTVTRVTSGNHTTSRFGLRGTEDIGGGLKGKFMLETAVGADTGSSGSTSGGNTRFFDRAAWLGLEGGFGEIRLGRQDTPIGAIVGNTAILGGQAYDDMAIVGTFAASSSAFRRSDNAITYVLPKLADGLSAQLQYSTDVNGVEADNDAGKHYGLSVQYAAGPIGAGLGYLTAKSDADEDTKQKAILAYVSYDFGAAKVTGYLNQDDQTDADKKRKVYGVRVDVPVTDAFKAQVSLSQAKDIGFGATADNDAKILALKGTYSLSKRTSLYALFTHVSNDDGANLRIGASVPSVDAPAAGDSARGLAVGVVHRF